MPHSLFRELSPASNCGVPGRCVLNCTNGDWNTSEWPCKECFNLKLIKPTRQTLPARESSDVLISSPRIAINVILQKRYNANCAENHSEECRRNRLYESMEYVSSSMSADQSKYFAPSNVFFDDQVVKPHLWSREHYSYLTRSVLNSQFMQINEHVCMRLSRQLAFTIST